MIPIGTTTISLLHSFTDVISSILIHRITNTIDEWSLLVINEMRKILNGLTEVFSVRFLLIISNNH